MATTLTADNAHALQNAQGHLSRLINLHACHECMTDRVEGRRFASQGRPAELTWKQRVLLIKELGFTGDNWADTAEAIEERVREMPLSLLFRTGWFRTCEEAETAEFELLLSTGGPALRITGDVLDDSLVGPVMQMQDWGTPWVDVCTDAQDDRALVWFIDHFCAPEA
jgi:hypothetical protein